jgi:hypothetical protein
MGRKIMPLYMMGRLVYSSPRTTNVLCIKDEVSLFLAVGMVFQEGVRFKAGGKPVEDESLPIKVCRPHLEIASLTRGEVLRFIFLKALVVGVVFRKIAAHSHWDVRHAEHTGRQCQ